MREGGSQGGRETNRPNQNQLPHPPPTPLDPPSLWSACEARYLAGRPSCAVRCTPLKAPSISGQKRRRIWRMVGPPTVSPTTRLVCTSAFSVQR